MYAKDCPGLRRQRPSRPTDCAEKSFIKRIAFFPLVALGMTACEDVIQPAMDHGPTLAVTASGNPFTGSWENIDPIDGSLQHMTIGRPPKMPVHWRDDVTSGCGGGVPADVFGFGVITSTNPWTLLLEGDVYCYTRGKGGRQLWLHLKIDFQYLPVKDVLAIGDPQQHPDWLCWYRTAHPESCE